jgi:hypothetical protein
MYYNAHKFLGWKKDFFESKLLYYSIEMNLAFLFHEEKSLLISRFENKKFNTMYKTKWCLYSRLIRQVVRRCLSFGRQGRALS